MSQTEHGTAPAASAPSPQDVSPVARPGSNRPRPAIRLTDFLVGMIPVVAGLSLLTLLAWQRTRSLENHYEAGAKALLQRREIPAAQARLKRLLEINPGRDETRFQLGLTYAALNQPDHAEQVIRSLAPRDGKGYLPARFWLAERLSQSAPRSPAAAEDCEAQLRLIFKEKPTSLSATLLLGKLYAVTGRPKLARPLLESVAAGRPAVMLMLAGCSDALGDKDDALRRRREAVAVAREAIAKNPVQAEMYVVHASALSELGEFSAAVDSLDAGQARVKSDLMNPARAEICLVWARWFVKRYRPLQPLQAAECVSIVNTGLASDPSSEALMNMLQEFAQAKGPIGDNTRKILARQAELGGPASATGLMALAAGEFAAKRPSDARKYWEAGYKANPELPVLANNLAWSLAYVEPADPARALTMIDKAVASRPGDVRLLGTRGLILNRLGRYEEALKNLKQASTAGYAHPDVREGLAVALKNLGPKTPAE